LAYSGHGLGLKELKEIKTLQVLQLDNTQVTDAALKDVKGLNSLTILYLQNIPVTDAGLKELKELESLRHLYLSGTQVTPAGIQELKAARPKLEIQSGDPWISPRFAGVPPTHSIRAARRRSASSRQRECSDESARAAVQSGGDDRQDAHERVAALDRDRADQLARRGSEQLLAERGCGFAALDHVQQTRLRSRATLRCFDETALAAAKKSSRPARICSANSRAWLSSATSRRAIRAGIKVARMLPEVVLDAIRGIRLRAFPQRHR